MSYELIMNSSEQVFEIDKDILSFKLASEKIKEAEALDHPSILSEDELDIKNITDCYLAFRIKTTKKLFYTVNPSYFILPPNSTQKVKFLYYYVPGNGVNSTGHKFKIEGFKITDSEQNEEPKNLFLSYSKNKIPVEGHSEKRFVQLIIDNEISPRVDFSEENIGKISIPNDYQVVQEKKEETKPFQTVEDIITGKEEQKQENLNIENNNENEKNENDIKNENINDNENEKNENDIKNDNENDIKNNNENDIKNDNENDIKNSNENNINIDDKKEEKKETLMDKITGSGDTSNKIDESQNIKNENLSSNFNSGSNFDLSSNLNKNTTYSTYEVSEIKEVKLPIVNVVLALVISVLVGIYIAN